MLFNSVSFAIFLPVVFIFYWALPHKFRWTLLLVASYYFYMSWNPKYVVLILLTTVVSYTAGRFLEKQSNDKRKKIIVACALVICLGVLFVFKYYDFFSESLVTFLSLFTLNLNPITLKLVLPVGISFYTFQTISYVIDVYRGDIEAEKNFGVYATFVSFFPQLVAGPIERARNLLPQIKEKHEFDYDQAIVGLKLMLIGYYKKLVIADVVAQYVDTVYTDVTAYKGCDLAIVIFLFTIQIYCDFSGYSDIAIGTAKLLGINLMTNFRSPYFSESVKEFWSRWHISLSTWFKDYVYIPLGGNRCKKSRNYFNLLVTFLVSGLWHGANWTFVFWGAMHGSAQVIEKMLDKPIKVIKRKKIGSIISILVVFVFCNLAWVFFRADNFTDAIYVIVHAFDGITSIGAYLTSSCGLKKSSLLLILSTIFVLGIYDFLNIDGSLIEKRGGWNKAIQWIIYIVIGLMIVFLSQKGAAAEFVYFQF